MTSGGDRFAVPPAGPGGPAEDARMPGPGDAGAGAGGGGPAMPALPPEVADLLAIPGVQGTALGRTEIGDDAVVVYLLDEATRARLPQRVGGLPVVAVVTGPIDAQGAPGG
jgi:hypothetical protein